MTSPIFNLLPYQRRFFADRSRYKLGLFSRQTGKSFTTALEAADSCAEAELQQLPPRLWICLSAGERQSLEWMQKAKLHAQAYNLAAEIEGEDLGADLQRLLIRFKGGSRIIGLPANPDTARGYSGNVVLDEFAFHEDSRAIWRALVPTITRGYRLIVVSTPNGRSNMFYELHSQHPEFSKHKVTIVDAARDGLQVNLAELQAAIDPDGWQQEFMCEFLDENSALLPYDLIARAEAPEAELYALDTTYRGTLYAGMDIGRQKDLSVFWLIERHGDLSTTRQLTILDKAPFHQQLKFLRDTMAALPIRRLCLDATGIGAMLAEEAQRHLGSRVEPVQFTQAAKEDLAMRMLRTFQDGAIRIPASREVRDDLHKVTKLTTAAGNVRYVASRDGDGHADRFWACALALHAADAQANTLVDGLRLSAGAPSRYALTGPAPDLDDDARPTTSVWDY